MWLVHGTKKGALPLGLDKRKYGKHVTVISNVTLPERLSAELQQSLGVGGTARPRLRADGPAGPSGTR